MFYPLGDTGTESPESSHWREHALPSWQDLQGVHWIPYYLQRRHSVFSLRDTTLEQESQDVLPLV